MTQNNFKQLQYYNQLASNLNYNEKQCLDAFNIILTDEDNSLISLISRIEQLEKQHLNLSNKQKRMKKFLLQQFIGFLAAVIVVGLLSWYLFKDLTYLFSTAVVLISGIILDVHRKFNKAAK